QNVDVFSRAANDGGADEDGFQVTGAGALLEVGTGFELGHAAVDLAAVSVALDGEIQHAEAFLGGVFHFRSQQDGTRTSSEDRLAGGETAQSVLQVHEVQQLQHGGALATGDHEAVDGFHVLSGTDKDGLGSGARDGLGVSFEIALERENADAFGHDYQPRVCISSLSGSFAMSRPAMAMPSSSLASSSFCGSLK